MEPIAVERRSGRGPLAWLIVSQALALLSLLPWAVLFALSSLDSGVSGVGGWLVLLIVWGYPVVLAACVFMAWRAWRRGNVRRALVASTLPLLWAVPLLGWVGWLLTTPK